jgi:hypothetical protein
LRLPARASRSELARDTSQDADDIKPFSIKPFSAGLPIALKNATE